ncbi:UdgX family uracil-DNA binding protein [Rhodanobacter sp. Col0626]|uniref:UdgX family uracil-DNA binding protein n=1 Tax=Rhodanobacter sp. Col0626 TaxID=3415679 RepID=UPI003CEB797A
MTCEVVIPLAKPVDDIPAGNLATLRRKAGHCRACPLWRDATRTVFGEGPVHAPAMLIGEQPGAQEDIAGEPFVGPAGQLLDRAMADAGLDRKALYLTNTVKHFKYEVRGTAKLHKRANASEQAACRQWLAAELLRVQPRLVIGLGAMAAQTLFGKSFRITSQRGEWHDLGEGVRGLATWHPSAVLRMPRQERRQQAYAELVADLREVAAALDSVGNAGASS